MFTERQFRNWQDRCREIDADPQRRDPVADAEKREAERHALMRQTLEGTKGSAPASNLAHTKRDLHTPGAAYGIGSQRHAADGSLWQRTA